jgi:transcriptional regulator with XRE-family HTH domain
MTNDGPNHLKAWRLFRRMTQQELADAVEPPTTKQVIQAIESGARGLSDKWLRRLAPALGTTPGILIDFAPDKVDTEIMDIWRDIPTEERDRARRALEIFRKTGTGG